MNPHRMLDAAQLVNPMRRSVIVAAGLITELIIGVGGTAVTRAAEMQKATAGFAVQQQADRLSITYAGQPVTEFVFADQRILRPYFSNLQLPGGERVTRNHPPLAGTDAADHDSMHPGLWLAFGDIGGSDCWRNKGRIQHVRLSQLPVISESRVDFVSECEIVSAEEDTICHLTNRLALLAKPAGWLLVWDAAFRSQDRDFSFGDQEEMGFGARVATSITEQRGGVIVNSQGQRSAKSTWGQAADWCDYSGTVNGRPIGVTLLADKMNFRESWWHNRDYGLFVANPFGRAAMKQGETSQVVVKRGETFRLRFGAMIHGGEYDPGQAAADLFGFQFGTTLPSERSP